MLCVKSTVALSEILCVVLVTLYLLLVILILYCSVPFPRI